MHSSFVSEIILEELFQIYLSYTYKGKSVHKMKHDNLILILLKTRK